MSQAINTKTGLQVLWRYDNRHQELLLSADVREYAAGRHQHAVSGVNHLSLLRLYLTHRHIRRTHGPEDRRTYGQFRSVLNEITIKRITSQRGWLSGPLLFLFTAFTAD